VVLIAACNQSPEGQNPPKAQSVPAKPRPTLVASFYPLYEFARQVAGDSAEVTSLIPPRVEPHDWEPAPQDVARLEKARVFVYNGAGFEPWADKLWPTSAAPDRRSSSPPRGSSRGSPWPRSRPRSQEAGTRARRTPRRQDPHVWLDPVLAQQSRPSRRRWPGGRRMPALRHQRQDLASACAARQASGACPLRGARSWCPTRPSRTRPNIPPHPGPVVGSRPTPSRARPIAQIVHCPTPQGQVHLLRDPGERSWRDPGAEVGARPSS
jgi:hypothetical protein